MTESVHQRKLVKLNLNVLMLTKIVHVGVGCLFLAVCLIRMINYHFSNGHHLGFEAAILYWQTERIAV